MPDRDGNIEGRLEKMLAANEVNPAIHDSALGNTSVNGNIRS